MSLDYAVPVVWNPSNFNGTQTQLDAACFGLLSIPPEVRPNIFQQGGTGPLVCAIRLGSEATIPPYDSSSVTSSQGGTTFGRFATVYPLGGASAVFTDTSLLLHEACHYMNGTSGGFPALGFYESGSNSAYGWRIPLGRPSATQLDLSFHPTIVAARDTLFISSYIGHPFVSYAATSIGEYVTEIMAAWLMMITDPTLTYLRGGTRTFRDRFVYYAANDPTRASAIDALFRQYFRLGASYKRVLTGNDLTRWDAGASARTSSSDSAATVGGWTLPAAASWTPPGF